MKSKAPQGQKVVRHFLDFMRMPYAAFIIRPHSGSAGFYGLANHGFRLTLFACTRGYYYMIPKGSMEFC